MVTDLVAWHTRATRYVRAKRWREEEVEDLVQAMTLYALEHPETHVNMDLAYLRARATLHPHLRRRVHQNARTVSAEAHPVQAPVETDLLAAQWLQRQVAMLASGTRQIVEAYFWGEDLLATIAQHHGVSAPRISQIITQSVQDLGVRYLAGQPHEDLLWPELVWEVQWL